jgi:CheY-like chemotaxis protein
MSWLQILLAEDNRGDVLLVQKALALHNVSYHLHLVQDGGEALDFLARIGIGREAPCPDLILLDLNLPKVDGTAILEELRKHPECACTPVIVISSSDTSRDRQRIEALGVARYFHKPTNLDDFLKLGLLVRQVIQESGLTTG